MIVTNMLASEGEIMYVNRKVQRDQSGLSDSDVRMCIVRLVLGNCAKLKLWKGFHHSENVI